MRGPQDSTTTTAGERPYAAPVLRHVGTLKDLTAGKKSAAADQLTGQPPGEFSV